MTIDLVFITYNRLGYTRLALESLLADPKEEFSLTIWDNGSGDDVRGYLSSVNDPRIVRKVFARENAGLKGAVNDVISNSSADLLGIIPDDFLVTPGWTRPLAEAHAEVPELGIIGCWHFSPEDFDYERAKHKIQTFGRHQVLRHPWTGGGAGLFKLKAVKECGLLQSNSTPGYWMEMASKGYVNGFYFPLVYVEHMDYPWSEHYQSGSNGGKGQHGGLTYKDRGICTVEDAGKWYKAVVDEILDGPWDVDCYVGWRGRLRRMKRRVKRVVGSL